jgi:hypothetical protein
MVAWAGLPVPSLVPTFPEAQVILHTDIPTRAQVERLLTGRDPSSVSIYLPTDPASSGAAEQILLKNLASDAADRLRQAGAAKSDVSAFEDEIADVVDDSMFWRYQARSLALFATPSGLTTFRLPNRLPELVSVSDRFHLKPLLRAVTFPQVGFLLALAQGSVRLLEVMPDTGPVRVDVPDLPEDVASAARKSAITDRAPKGRLQGAEGQKVHMSMYARHIDQALRPLLTGLDVPLILAATEPLDAIYRSVNTYPHLAPTTIAGSPERTPDGELAAQARGVLDEVYAAELVRLHELFERREPEGRTSTDVANLARAATFGMVDTVLVDIEAVVPGTIDEVTGEVTFSSDEGAGYGVIDEIARRVWLAGGRVLAVRRDDLPRGGEVAAILRYAM